ncbi:OSJNBa0042D13.18 protein, related [Eimeria necatrix]|uniref:OSJNBa0042D13.18 protein, related n=1 Tax=Eimeria necatrix TaxID=51315 RepID=U6MHF3_9EIME|nr:OSJNBa0042D13.18 protein, related [Eimeria necatrix]CDJ62503.1 OSJNBa0042D13.18 protein, related [Eimeria necatrix]
MSQSQLLTELAKVPWNGNPKEYTDRFAAVAERGLGFAPDELADYYCTGLPTDLHLLITNNGQVKYQSWEQAATAATRLYEPKQSVLELRERTSRAITAAVQANGPRGRQEIENCPGGTHANCFECQGSRTSGTCLPRQRGTYQTSGGNMQCGTLCSGLSYILSEETPEATTDSSRKSAEATEDGYRSDATEIVPHWWRETCTKESYDQGGALCCAGATASDKLRTYVNDHWCELPVVRPGETTLQRDSPTVVHPRTPAEQAYKILAKQVAGMSADEAAVFLRAPPRRYKSHAKSKAKARITSLVRQAAAGTNDLRTPLHGLHLILALPEAGSAVPRRLSDEWQGALCCALIGNQPTSSGWRSPLASTASVAAESDEESPWPMAKLEHTLFDEWITSPVAQDIPCEIAQVLHEYRAVFPDALPKGLPPKRPHDHHILLVPGKLPAKSATYRMTLDQLTFHKQEIVKLLDSGWIGPTYSPICSPMTMVDKRDDGSGERKMRMVVNYQALNALTIAPDFPLPPIQTILEMLAATSIFPPWILKQASIRYANINAYLQPLLGQGIVAYLDDVLIYSSDLSGHVPLLRQVLSIFLRHQFYPKFRKCKFARQTITYLGYTISAAGIKPAEDKIAATRHWPEVLENETQVRPFLCTINYYRIFMGPDYADVARPLVLLTRKDVSFEWTELHTQAVRQLKQRLINFTTLQVPDTTKPFELYTDASGYAIKAVVEQDGKPIGFLSQVMNPSIYDQELLALVMALNKWSHLFRVSKVTAYTDHQALTHLQRLQASKPLRGRTARWLDFLAKFPDLHITRPSRPEEAFAALSKHYYWPGMRAYTTAYVESCTHSRASESLKEKPAGLLQQLPVSSRRWAHVSLDFITDIPLTTTGHDSILVMDHSNSKMAHFVPAKKSFIAADTVELLADRLIRYHGFPEVLISDRDPRFQSDL